MVSTTYRIPYCRYFKLLFLPIEDLMTCQLSFDWFINAPNYAQDNYLFSPLRCICNEGIMLIRVINMELMKQQTDRSAE